MNTIMDNDLKEISSMVKNIIDDDRIGHLFDQIINLFPNDKT